ncbi:MAG: hypothetical protein PHE28_05205, partial [Bacteroidales bacterium]|nr:hypothetical protein [Bacteroidales bacterium]
GDKWMAQMIKGETINFKKLAAMIEKSSTVSKGDALNALDALVSSTTWMLQEGHSVKFDGLEPSILRLRLRRLILQKR